MDQDLKHQKYQSFCIARSATLICGCIHILTGKMNVNWQHFFLWALLVAHVPKVLLALVRSSEECSLILNLVHCGRVFLVVCVACSLQLPHMCSQVDNLAHLQGSFSLGGAPK